MLIITTPKHDLYKNSTDYLPSKTKNNIKHDNTSYAQKITYKKQLNTIYRIGIGILAVLGVATILPYVLYSKKIINLWNQAINGIDKKIVLIKEISLAKEPPLATQSIHNVMMPKATSKTPPAARNIHDVMMSHATSETLIVMRGFFTNAEELSLEYEKMKRLLTEAVKLQHVKCTFDDKEKTFTFYHGPHEMKAICAKYKLNAINEKTTLEQHPDLSLSGNGFHQTMQNQDYNVQRENLLKDSREFFKVRKIKNIEIEQGDQHQDPKQLMKSLFEKNEGICIGENHSDFAPKKILIDNMSALKDFGVKTLYLEHLHYNTKTQKLLDDYSDSQTEEMPGHLKELLQYMDYGHGLDRKTEGTFTNLVIAAKKTRIRIVAIDTAISYSCGSELKMGVVNSKERYEGMNAVATAIIEENQKKSKGKYVALIGSGHLTTAKEEQVPGIAQLLGIPSVIIEKTEGPTNINYKATSKPELEHLSAYIKIGKPPERSKIFQIFKTIFNF